MAGLTDLLGTLLQQGMTQSGLGLDAQVVAYIDRTMGVKQA